MTGPLDVARREILRTAYVDQFEVTLLLDQPVCEFSGGEMILAVCQRIGDESALRTLHPLSVMRMNSIVRKGVFMFGIFFSVLVVEEVADRTVPHNRSRC